MADDCSIVIAPIAPDGSVCEICGKPAPWQMYCKDCGNILRYYCDDHAYLSQGDEKLENHVKKAYLNKEPLKMGKRILKVQSEWQTHLNNMDRKIL